MKTQHQIAESVGLTQAALSNILNGRRGLSWDTAKRFSETFGNDPSWWMDATPEKIRKTIKIAQTEAA